MKIFVNLETLKVTPYSKELVDSHNGDHEQVTGHVIASVMITGDTTQISLLHPNTQALGHVDVLIIYQDGDVSFRDHGSARLKLNERRAEFLFPTGGMSLISVAIAIEEYLHELIGFRRLLRDKILGVVSKHPTD